MAVLRTYERFTHTPVFAIGAVDKFAAARARKDPNAPGQPLEIPPVLGDVTFFVTSRVTAPAAPYEPSLEFISWRNRGGFFLFSGETRTPDRPGTAKLTPGRYGLRVESDYYQLIERNFDWPPAAVYDKNQDLDLLPGPAYPFPNFDLRQRELEVTLLRGSLFNPGGDPVEEVKVELIAPALPPRFEAFSECTTNERGEWVLALVQLERPNIGDPVPDLAHSRIRVNLPGGAYEADVNVTQGQENSLPQTALRGRVRKPGGAPFPRVKITTSVAAGESITRDDGEWFFYFELRQGAGAVTVTATAPDGRTADANVVIVPRSTVRVPEMEIA